MSYPKPLSERSLKRLYAESGLSEKQMDFLRRFFMACANLYGVIVATEAWDVYRELSSKTETVRLHRREMYAALGILRRETVPFYVFEADEVFSEEERTDRYRVVALRDLIYSGYGKFRHMYQVMDAAQGRSYFVPEDLMEYTVMPESEYEHKLLDMLEHMKSTAKEYTDRWNRTYPCKYRGRMLKDFSYISRSQEVELQRLRGELKEYKGNPKKAAKYEAELNSKNAAQYLVDNLKWYSNLSNVSPMQSIEWFIDDLTAMGVVFSGEKQLQTLINAATEMHNHQHLWANRGWAPDDMSRQRRGHGIPPICFGPGIQKAFADGTMDKAEMIQELKKRGIEIVE